VATAELFCCNTQGWVSVRCRTILIKACSSCVQPLQSIQAALRPPHYTCSCNMHSHASPLLSSPPGSPACVYGLEQCKATAAVPSKRGPAQRKTGQEVVVVVVVVVVLVCGRNNNLLELNWLSVHSCSHTYGCFCITPVGKNCIIQHLGKTASYSTVLSHQQSSLCHQQQLVTATAIQDLLVSC